MDIAAVLCEIDEEIRRLSKARQILEQYFSPVMRPRRRPAKQTARTRVLAKGAEDTRESAAPEVQVTLVPPRRKREYHRRAKTVPQVLRAIDMPVSATPVFVVRPAKDTPSEAPDPPPAEVDSSRLETAIRKHLLGDSGTHAEV